MFIIDVFLVITAVIVLIRVASKPLTKHSILRIVSQHNTLVIFAFFFRVHGDGSVFTSGIRYIVVVIILVPTSV